MTQHKDNSNDEDDYDNYNYDDVDGEGRASSTVSEVPEDEVDEDGNQGGVSGNNFDVAEAIGDQGHHQQQPTSWGASAGNSAFSRYSAERERSTQMRRNPSSRQWSAQQPPTLEQYYRGELPSRSNTGIGGGGGDGRAAKQKPTVSLTMASLEEKSSIVKATPATLFNKLWVMPAF